MQLGNLAETTAVSPELAADDLVGMSGLLASLQRSFFTEFSLWDGSQGTLVRGSVGSGLGDRWIPAEWIQHLSREGRAAFAAEGDGCAILAMPFASSTQKRFVAAAGFLLRPVNGEEDVEEIAGLLDLCSAEARRWVYQRTAWSRECLLSLGSAVCEKLAAEACAHRLTKEVDQVSRHLAATYEEISLLYTITRNLRISRTDEELGKLAVEWMAECVPAESFAVQYLPTCDDGSGSCRSRTRSGPLMITQGGCPVDSEQFGRLLTTLNLDAGSGPYIANRRTTDSADWGFPAVRQLILAPLAEGNNVFGWIAAFNHREAVDFGSVEANLLSSIGSLLGIHSGNRDLYRQQSSLVASVVRALVSAIDAKDPYTSGHSDRVARFAVRIALEMQCHPKLLNTIYMAGLLHDVGKIGIGDQVLRKPGRLTEAEYEHIKLHPGLGHRILADLKQLGDVLPAVLHHHEQWNGLGYPVGLAADEIPRIARIIAVADAYDAMSSDRPYRSGMPPEKVDEIFREGAGKFWDPDVVQAYFAARPDFAEIMRTEASPVDVVPKEWT